jgi:hypothetical protein
MFLSGIDLDPDLAGMKADIIHMIWVNCLAIFLEVSGL